MAIDRRATRLGVLGLVALILFSLIGVRLWFLQTVKADELQQLSTFASTRTVQIPPERGRIFDVEGRILADNQRILTVAVDWQQLRKRTDRLEIFRRLSAWVGVPIEDMEGGAGRYSVISMADVLEHMPYPKAGLKAAHRLLRPGGVLFVSMPNMDSMVWRALDASGSNPYWGEIEHYHNFTRQRLYALLDEHGFSPVHYDISERYRCCMEVIAEKR